MKKTFIKISAGLNLLVFVIIAIVLSGIPVQWISDYFIGASHKRWVSQFELLPVQSGDIVFLGDSITEGGSWHELFPDQPVRNRGIGGDTTTGVLARLHQVTDGKPSKVFLLIGTNDLAMGAEVADIVANIESIVDAIQASSTKTQVFVQSVLPRDADYREEIEAINAEIRQVIQGKAEWVDLYPLMLNKQNGSIRDDLSNDELHLMGEGYVLWRDAIKPFISGLPGSSMRKVSYEKD